MNQAPSAVNAPPYPPGSSTEIPQALSQSTVPAGQSANSAGGSGNFSQDSQSDAEPEPLPPDVGSLRDFIAQGASTESPLGVQLRPNCTELGSQEACGLEVLGVRPGSPAAKAGIKPYHALAHHVLDGAAVAAAFVFPPAILGLAIIDSTQIGESYDLIIGVDGTRVRSIIDFENATADLRPGDVTYVMIVRDGKRVQLPVRLPAGQPLASW